MLAAEKIRAIHETVDEQKVAIVFQPISDVQKRRLIAYDIEAQCRQVFANVRAVLEASGARWEDLVDVTVFLTDMARDLFPQATLQRSQVFTAVVDGLALATAKGASTGARRREATQAWQLRRRSGGSPRAHRAHS